MLAFVRSLLRLSRLTTTRFSLWYLISFWLYGTFTVHEQLNCRKNASYVTKCVQLVYSYAGCL